MKKTVLFVLAALMVTLPAFAADDAQVNLGIQQVQQARQGIADFLNSLPPYLRGYAAQLNGVDATLAQAQNTLELSLQTNVTGYACTVQEKGFQHVYVGHGKTQGDAYADAMNQCGTQCSTFGYNNLGCEPVQN